MINQGSADDGYAIECLCEYGGRETDGLEDGIGLASFASDLENPGGNEAAISNVSFCGVVEEIDETREA